MATATQFDAATAPAARTITSKLVLTLFGIVPLGAYVVLHLWTNLNSLAGEKQFNEAIEASRHHPWMIALEVFGLGVPLLVHTGIGLREIARGRPNNASYRYFGNLEYLLQRVAAVGVLLFIGAHVWRARIAPALATPGGHETWAGMHDALSEPITFGVYVLGVLGVCYHLANGLRTAAMRLGFVVSREAQARMQWIAAAVLLVLLAMSAMAIAGFQPFAEVRS
jgi:succinate dehydrogenase / fumarate reductase cytochrome b subunit